MGKNSALRRKIAKKKAAAVAVTLDNAKPHQMAALMAEREKLIANAEKRLPKNKATIYAKPKDNGGRDK